MGKQSRQVTGYRIVTVYRASEESFCGQEPSTPVILRKEIDVSQGLRDRIEGFARAVASLDVRKLEQESVELSRSKGPDDASERYARVFDLQNKVTRNARVAKRALASLRNAMHRTSRAGRAELVLKIRKIEEAISDICEESGKKGKMSLRDYLDRVEAYPNGMRQLGRIIAMLERHDENL